LNIDKLRYTVTLGVNQFTEASTQKTAYVCSGTACNWYGILYRNSAALIVAYPIT